MMPSQTAYFDVSHDGTLVYMPRSALQITRSLVWIDRSGREELLPSPARAYRAPRLSPDGTRVAVEIHEEQNDIWILEVNRDARKQFTSGPALDVLPLWSPNGSRLYFGSNLDGEMQTYWQAADGTGQPERVTDGPATPASISPDGAHLVLQVVGSAPDLALLRLETHDRPQPLILTPDIENNGQISPGRSVDRLRPVEAGSAWNQCPALPRTSAAAPGRCLPAEGRNQSGRGTVRSCST